MLYREKFRNFKSFLQIRIWNNLVWCKSHFVLGLLMFWFCFVKLWSWILTIACISINVQLQLSLDLFCGKWVYLFLKFIKLTLHLVHLSLLKLQLLISLS